MARVAGNKSFQKAKAEETITQPVKKEAAKKAPSKGKKKTTKKKK